MHSPKIVNKEFSLSIYLRAQCALLHRYPKSVQVRFVPLYWDQNTLGISLNWNFSSLVTAKGTCTPLSWVSSVCIEHKGETTRKPSVYWNEAVCTSSNKIVSGFICLPDSLVVCTNILIYVVLKIEHRTLCMISIINLYSPDTSLL